MDNMKKRIEEDFQEYRRRFPNIPNLEKDEYAFNFWVLDKFFNIDEELIQDMIDRVVDYKDLAIDAFAIYEDTKECFLIQNKYYSESTPLSADYVKNNFLINGIKALEQGTYNKSEELQNFFNKYKEEEDFRVYLQLYVTNDKTSPEIDSYIKEYNINNQKYNAEIFYLSKIKDKYFGELLESKKKMSVDIFTINKGTILQINNADYKLQNNIDAKYVYTPLISIYHIYKKAEDEKYPLFEENIREYLGNKGFNKGIVNTLQKKEERKNFFYYNNGITMICDGMSSINNNLKSAGGQLTASFTVYNPQIVNGCQTVNSIYNYMKNFSEDKLEEEFKDCFVMLKILMIEKENEEDSNLVKDIVKYNNSQNAIKEKAFAAVKDTFKRIQIDFKARGFLLLIKASDNYQYKSNINFSDLKDIINKEKIERFGLEINKIEDLYIPLEKLLQIILAFVSGGFAAYTTKHNLLKEGSKEYDAVVNFIKDSTTDQLLELYMLYMRGESEKKQSEDKRSPIPYYLIDGFAKYECNERDKSKIMSELDSKDKIDRLILLYKKVSKLYAREMNKKNIDYNKMLKTSIDYALFHEQITIASI